MSSSSTWQDSKIAVSERDMARVVRTEDLGLEITQQPHEKPGDCPTTPPDDSLGGSSRSKEEINNALHDYCSSFDQTRLLRRRLTVVNGGDSNLHLHLKNSRTKTRQGERKPKPDNRVVL